MYVVSGFISIQGSSLTRSCNYHDEMWLMSLQSHGRSLKDSSECSIIQNWTWQFYMRMTKESIVIHTYHLAFTRDNLPEIWSHVGDILSKLVSIDTALNKQVKVFGQMVQCPWSKYQIRDLLRPLLFCLHSMDSLLQISRPAFLRRSCADPGVHNSLLPTLVSSRSLHSGSPPWSTPSNSSFLGLIFAHCINIYIT